MAEKVLESSDADTTERIGEQIGRALKGGEVIELMSDLGGGKTTLTRGIARGAGSSDVVGSPTFTLSKVYKTQGLEIHHFDFYRLSQPGIMEHELHDVLSDPHCVVVVEWADIVSDVLPADRLTISINKTGDSSRKLACTYSDTTAHLVEAL